MGCEACGGSRLRREALGVTFKGRTIADVAMQSIDEVDGFFSGLVFSPGEAAVGEGLRGLVLQRTELLRKLGLGYLTLDRESTALSAGEAQRIRLSTQIGTGLRGILYTLDEPSVGLHHRDNGRLLEVLCKLRDNGNTVVMVEHDEEAMRNADVLIDMGPGAGLNGGEVLFNGRMEELFKGDAVKRFPLLERSRTRAFLMGTEGIDVPGERRKGNGEWLVVKGAVHHNLKNIDVPFRVGVSNVVTGVSGAGKSTLVHDILGKGLKRRLHKANTQPGQHGTIEGVAFIDKVIEIDQGPIGRTPRSNPATYTKVFDHIRDLFASLEESKARGWAKGRFSFNVKGGRCETCEGAGLKQMGMHFLGNVEVVCDECNGKRFNDETLEVRFKNKSIFDVLEMSIGEAVEFFAGDVKINRILGAMLELGLGYISLGQSATTLSGGEAQRVKLASELCRPAAGRTLYILDEPTTGLHAADIKILMEALEGLVEKGHTVITVEHHEDFIKRADWVVDLGPESGDGGGELVAVGTPEEVAKIAKSHTGKFLQKILFSKTKVFRGVQGGGFSKKPPWPPEAGRDSIQLKGVCTHNLKSIDVEIPVNGMTVITGVSGSGKSSLAFDTIFAEGQQRFLTRFSTYARRLVANMAGSGREMESCTGLMPTIAVSQKAASRNLRSTVGTMTEILDFYRLLFSRAGKRGEGEGLLFSNMFSFNHHQGACEECKGLGVKRVCDPEKLVSHP
ncbi:MAG: ATP-binding cassette domain-containing protein, partial [bacterium]|nr:ATP-binding cassette domain-containing protein [bacterium]